MNVGTSRRPLAAAGPHPRDVGLDGIPVAEVEVGLGERHDEVPGRLLSRRRVRDGVLACEGRVRPLPLDRVTAR